ncbi:hypothetical protein [Kocuria carniphila]|uniref:hypothetical protein n=1 Tax=Kocuria carniphila TaxID=262208 RepID=UPI0034DB40F7
MGTLAVGGLVASPAHAHEGRGHGHGGSELPNAPGSPRRWDAPWTKSRSPGVRPRRCRS